MVKLRLRRMGRKQRPVYDIVASDSRTPRDGRFLEKIGQYNPLAAGPQIVLKRDRAMHWIAVGAQPTDTVRSLLGREGVMLEIALKHKGVPSDEIAQKVTAHQARNAAKLPPVKKAAPAPAVDAPVIPETPVTPEAVEMISEGAPAPVVEQEAPAAAAEEAPAAAAMPAAGEVPVPVAEVPPGATEEAPAAEEAPVTPEEETPAAKAAPAEEGKPEAGK